MKERKSHTGFQLVPISMILNDCNAPFLQRQTRCFRNQARNAQTLQNVRRVCCEWDCTVSCNVYGLLRSFGSLDVSACGQCSGKVNAHRLSYDQSYLKMTTQMYEDRCEWVRIGMLQQLGALAEGVHARTTHHKCFSHALSRVIGLLRQWRRWTIFPRLHPVYDLHLRCHGHRCTLVPVDIEPFLHSLRNRMLFMFITVYLPISVLKIRPNWKWNCNYNKLSYRQQVAPTKSITADRRHNMWAIISTVDRPQGL